MEVRTLEQLLDKGIPQVSQIVFVFIFVFVQVEEAVLQHLAPWHHTALALSCSSALVTILPQFQARLYLFFGA